MSAPLVVVCTVVCTIAAEVPVRPAVSSPSPQEILAKARARPGRHGTLSEVACRRLTGWKAAKEPGCSVLWAGGGNAAVVVIQTECGGDSCSTETWVFTGERGRVHVTAAGGGGVEVLPDRGEVIADRVGMRDVRLVRIALDEPGRARPFANCMSPALSPGGRWIVCRNERGHVLRVRVEGGKPELVRRVRFDGEFVAYSYAYPDAVWFESATTVVVPRGGKPALKLPWVE